MPVKYAYRQDYHPPFPALEVVLINDDEGLRSAPLSALLDSGADGTLIPLAHLKDLLATPLRDALIRSHWGERRSVQMFAIDLEIAGVHFPSVFVIGDDQGDEVVLGRNLLNKLVVLLDGPAEKLSLR